jgi:hypothetical protein
MCEGRSEELDMFARLLVTTLTAILLLAGSLFAQGGEGRSGSVATRTASTGQRYVRRSKPIRRPVVRDSEPVIETGRLSIVVNEGGSRIFLSRPETGLETELTSGSSNAPSLIVRTLPTGGYKILAKKEGYFDEIRNVDILPDKRRKVVLNLRPQMALLTVNTNLADSEIDISGLGKFAGSLKKQFVRPGVYRVAVQRRGYVSQTATVELKSAGREQNISIVLQPLRIDSMLSLAAEKLGRNDFATATALTNDVLLLNPQHAKANLLYGEIAYKRGDLLATSFLMKAIRNGETMALPVKIFENEKLVDVEFRVDREAFSVRSTVRVDLNFSIHRADILEIRRSLDPAFMNYIVVKGRSDFHGRPIEPHLNIYSPLTAIIGEPHVPFCEADAAGSRSCTSDTDILHKIISEWLELK